MKVIALSGFANSGKDTIAAHLIEKHGALRTAFADPLKDMVAKEYDVPREWMDDRKYKESPLRQYPVDPKDVFCKMLSEFMVKEYRSEYSEATSEFRYWSGEFMGVFMDGLRKLYHTPRSLCILKGSVNRSVDSQYWVQQAIKTIKGKDDQAPFRTHIITDLRYKSEAEQLKQAFGRDLTLIRINRFNESPSSDPSELDLVGYGFDKYLDNTGSLENTLKQMDQIILKMPT